VALEASEVSFEASEVTFEASEVTFEASAGKSVQGWIFSFLSNISTNFRMRFARVSGLAAV
jgi:hypothetical protein